MKSRFTGKIIFIAPSDWGLGHSSRCILIIRQLSEENDVILGITPANERFLEEHFPQLEKIVLPSYDVHYSRWLPAWIKVLLQSVKIFRAIRLEKDALARIVAEKKIDVVISDTRFGFRNNGKY